MRYANLLLKLASCGHIPSDAIKAHFECEIGHKIKLQQGGGGNGRNEMMMYIFGRSAEYSLVGGPDSLHWLYWHLCRVY